MKKCPPHGLCLPCEWVRNRDGDTVIVRLRTGQEIAIRLKDCWAPEKQTKDGRASHRFLDVLLEKATRPLSVYFGLPDTGPNDTIDITDILKVFTFDRAVGRLFIGDIDVNEIMISRGHATREKPR